MDENSRFAPLLCGDMLRQGAHLVIARQDPAAPMSPSALCVSERARYDKFATKAAARSFLHRRLVLKRLLSYASGLPPTQVTYACNPFGKPGLAGAVRNTLHFSLSQGRDMCVVAICQDFEVGVDIEHVTARAAIDDVCGLLHPAEIACIQAAAEPPDAFLSMWVQKEAIAKRIGFGFSRPANAWSVLDHATQSHQEICDVAEHRICVSTIGQTAFSYWHIESI